MLDKIQNRLHELVVSDQLSNDDMLAIIRQLGGYLNLQTISSRSNELNVDYNCVKCSKAEKIELFGAKMTYENN